MEVKICEVCGGLGLVTKNVPVEHPDFGKAFPCPACKINLQARRNNISKISNLHYFQSKTFDTFHLDLFWLDQVQTQKLQFIYTKAKEYAENPKGWLLFLGGTGTGKTHLAAAIANANVEKGVRTIFSTAPDLLDYLRITYAPSSDSSYDQQFDLMKNVPLLVIDDLGAESASKWAQEKLYQLLNHRHQAELPTVITTNVKEHQFEERIASRLFDINLTAQLEMNLPDYRRGGHELKQNSSVSELSDLEQYKDMTFENFTIAPEDKVTHREVNKIYHYAQKPEGWLVIVGGIGSGKTHLAAGVANHWKPLNKMQALIVNTPDLIDFLMATFNPDSKVTLNKRFDEIRNVDLLVLDDFGSVEKISYWVSQKLFQLIDHRYLKRLPTVITINEAKVALIRERYPEISSRLTDTRFSTWVGLKVSDYRRPR